MECAQEIPCSWFPVWDLIESILMNHYQPLSTITVSTITSHYQPFPTILRSLSDSTVMNIDEQASMVPFGPWVSCKPKAVWTMIDGDEVADGHPPKNKLYNHSFINTMNPFAWWISMLILHMFFGFFSPVHVYQKKGMHAQVCMHQACSHIS